MTFGDPAGDCGYPPLTERVTLTLEEDGSASLAQAQHFSIGTWHVKDGVLTIELLLNTEFPETYTLTSNDGGETLTGQNTYEDGAGCVTTYQIDAVRER